MLKKILFPLLAATLTGCASLSFRPTTFEVLRPADYTLPTWVDTVIVVDGVVEPQFSDLSLDPTNEQLCNHAKKIWKVFPLHTCEATAERFNTSGFLTAKCFDGIRTNRSNEQILDSLLAGHKATIVIMLDRINVESSIFADSSNQSSDDDEAGSEDCVKMLSIVHSEFSIYQSAKEKFATETRSDSLTYISCGGTLKEIVSRLPDVGSKYADMHQTVGTNIADMFIPCWQRVRRTIYVTDTPNMLAAVDYLDKGDWESARNLWIKESMESRSIENKVRATMNVALSYEREDNSVKAGVWCSKALDLIEAANEKTQNALAREKMRAQNMFYYLLDRQNEKNVLDKQMN